MNQKKLSWDSFKILLDQEIFPIYDQHEKAFDKVGLHGRRHIARSLIFGEIMAKFYAFKSNKKAEVDFDGIRFAIAFHDSAREGNGIDLWEKQSAENCYQFLIKNGYETHYSKLVSESIISKKNDIKNLSNQIVYDADVLEIMRLFSDSKTGVEKFRNQELLFLSSKDFYNQELTENDILDREEFIREIWQFIYETENHFSRPENKDFLAQYLHNLTQNKTKFKILNTWFSLEN